MQAFRQAPMPSPRAQTWTTRGAKSSSQTGILVAVADPVEGLDLVEVLVHGFELLAQALMCESMVRSST